MAKTDELRWVACSVDMGWGVSQSRHLIMGKGLTTLCGATASHPEVWRGNSTKPVCVECSKTHIARLEVAISE